MFHGKIIRFFLAGVMALTVVPTRAASLPEGQALSVSPADIRPASRFDADLMWVATAREFYFANVDFKNRYYRDGYAPLFLPHGARIKALVVSYMDRGCGVRQDIQVVLLRQNTADGTVQKLGEITSFGLAVNPNRATLTDEKIENDVVDNNAFSYSLLVQFGNIKRERVRFHGAVIIYE